MKKKKVITTILIIVLIIFAIFIYFKYFTITDNYLIYADELNGEEFLAGATDILYYGKDINYGDEYYSGEDTNGIICIYTRYSRFDEYKNTHPIFIVGNVKKVYVGETLIDYTSEINKYY